MGQAVPPPKPAEKETPAEDMQAAEEPKAEETKEESKEEVKEEVKAETTEVKTEAVETSTETAKPEVSKDEIDEILNEGMELAEDEDKKSTAKGRKRIEGMADVFKKMIEDDQIIPFDDDKDLEDYSAKDWKELIQANMDERANKVRRETPKQFFDSLPQELQIAAKYVADGGQDLKGLFATLSQVEQTRSLDMSSEKGQEHIIREYLTATGYGTVEEVNEEIEIWKDLGKLE